MARLLERYKETVRPELMKQFGLKNPLSVPRLDKIVVSMGVGSAVEEKEKLDNAAEDLATVTGQRPVATRARKSVSGFKLRQGMSIGLMVTLRGKRMYEFLDRLISVAIPRIRDFRGLLTRAFDGHGNYSLGLGEQLVFPEVSVDKVKSVQGMNVTIVVDNSDDEKSKALLGALGMPFRTVES